MKKIKVSELVMNRVVQSLAELQSQRMPGQKSIQLAYFIKEFDKAFGHIMKELQLINAKQTESHEILIKKIMADYPDITDDMTEAMIFNVHPEIKDILHKAADEFKEKQDKILDLEIEIPLLKIDIIKDLEFTAEHFRGLEVTVLV